MEIIFWNIGKLLNKDKLDLIDKAIELKKPDIFCIAEGSSSKENTTSINDLFYKHNYRCYYSPLFSDNEKLKLNYAYNRLGLKVYIKSSFSPVETFLFEKQREDGRIICVRTYVKYQPLSIIFIHNRSKSNNREVTDDQRAFILQLRQMIDSIERSQKGDNIIILGDFNLEPWDNILRHKKYLGSSFLLKHNNINKRTSSTLQFYFNPLLESIMYSKIENLAGTYYNDSHGWALYDYVLYNTANINIDYSVITEFETGKEFLNYDTTINCSFLKKEIDHLPIYTKIL